MVEKLEPLNELEKCLALTKDGKSSFDDFVSVLMKSELYIASVSDISGSKDSLVPLLFDRDGVPMAAVFTDKTRTSLYPDKIKGLAQKSGEELLRSTPSGYGLVINPGYDVGLEILPEGIKNLLSH